MWLVQSHCSQLGISSLETRLPPKSAVSRFFFAIVFDADSSPANSHAELAELRDPPKGGWLVDSSGFDTLLRRVTNSMFRQNARTSPFWQQKHNHDDYIFVVFYSFGLFFEIRPRRISDLR